MPPETLTYVKFSELLGKAFYGLNLPDAVRTEEEVQKIKQQEQQQQVMAQGAQALAGAAGQGVGEQAAAAMAQQ